MPLVVIAWQGRFDSKGSYHDGCRDHQNRVLKWEKEIGLHSEYSIGKSEFIAKEQSGGSVDGKLLKGNTRASGILAKTT